MARRLPGIRLRMEQAAIELFESEGYTATTAAAIAARAGTTERTFFRHFAEKAEAAFGDESRLREIFTDAIAAADAASSWEQMQAGLLAVAAELDDHVASFRRRVAVIARNPELAALESHRAEAWVDLGVLALHARGGRAEEMDLTAAIGLAAFRVALVRWGSGDSSLRAHVAWACSQVCAVAQAEGV